MSDMIKNAIDMFGAIEASDLTVTLSYSTSAPALTCAVSDGKRTYEFVEQCRGAELGFIERSVDHFIKGTLPQ